jgi:hypothetical protein
MSDVIYHALLKRSTAQPFASPKVGDLTTLCRFGAAERDVFGEAKCVT